MTSVNDSDANMADEKRARAATGSMASEYISTDTVASISAPPGASMGEAVDRIISTV